MMNSIDVADSGLNESSTGYINFYLQKSNPIFANIKKKNEVSALFVNETRTFNNQTSEWETIMNKVLMIGAVAQVRS